MTVSPVRICIEQNAMGKPNNDELRRMGLPVRIPPRRTQTKRDIIEFSGGV